MKNQTTTRRIQLKDHPEKDKAKLVMIVADVKVQKRKAFYIIVFAKGIKLSKAGAPK